MNSGHLYITCPQCTDIYCLPVLLKCGHNICRVCLFNYWEWKGLRECPVCGIVSDTKRPPINLALHNVAKEHKVLIMTSSQNKCCQHNEKLKIFCHNDGELICLICQLSKEHKVHECSPVEEAAEQKKVCENRNTSTTTQVGGSLLNHRPQAMVLTLKGMEELLLQV
uniref:Uncharacterized protein n=1 Tax=Neolamprologus brichardi TaxID=32507 RepID=A0A3Q4HG26_NEOBR